MALTQAANSGAGGNGPADRDENPRLPVMLRVPRRMLAEIDAEARRFGLSRAAYMLSSVIRQLERREG